MHLQEAPRRPGHGRVREDRDLPPDGPRGALEQLGFPGSADLFGDGSVTLLVAGTHGYGAVAGGVSAGVETLVHAGDAFVHAAELEGDEGLPRGVRAYRLALHEDKPTARRTLSAFRRLRRERPELALVNAHDGSLLGRLLSFPAVFG